MPLQLRAALPEIMKDKALAPPPKHALHIRGSKVGQPPIHPVNSLADMEQPCAEGLAYWMGRALLCANRKAAWCFVAGGS
jgi:hypothetical protein